MEEIKEEIKEEPFELKHKRVKAAKIVKEKKPRKYSFIDAF
jgi:hypothetical protein